MATLIHVNGEQESLVPANGTQFVLQELQRLVGGYIEPVAARGTAWGGVLLVDEDGLLKRLPANMFASQLAGHRIVGPALLLSSADWDAAADGPDAEAQPGSNGTSTLS